MPDPSSDLARLQALSEIGKLYVSQPEPAALLTSIVDRAATARSIECYAVVVVDSVGSSPRLWPTPRL
jgi:RecA/RadA recombinase